MLELTTGTAEQQATGVEVEVELLNDKVEDGFDMQMQGATTSVAAGMRTGGAGIMASAA